MVAKEHEMRRMIWVVIVVAALSLTACLSPGTLQSFMAAAVDQPGGESTATAQNPADTVVQLTIVNNTDYEITAMTLRAEGGEGRPLDVLLAPGAETTVEAQGGTVTLTAYLDINGTLVDISEVVALDGGPGAAYRWSVTDLPADTAIGYGYMDDEPYDPYAYLNETEQNGYAYLRRFDEWFASLDTDE